VPSKERIHGIDVRHRLFSDEIRWKTHDPVEILDAGEAIREIRSPYLLSIGESVV